jgi:hypothetical protein
MAFESRTAFDCRALWHGGAPWFPGLSYKGCGCAVSQLRFEYLQVF